MNVRLFSFMLFISLITTPLISNAVSQDRLTEEQALNILLSRIQKDNLYGNWTTVSCLSFITEEKTKDYIEFAVREKHGGKCSGDPNTAPVIDRYRVNRSTQKIQWYEPTEGDWLPYKSVLKFRLGK